MEVSAIRLETENGRLIRAMRIVVHRGAGQRERTGCLGLNKASVRRQMEGRFDIAHDRRIWSKWGAGMN